MARWSFLVLGVFVIGAMVLAACGGGASPNTLAPTDVPVPAPYTDMQNPFAGQADAVNAGKQLYAGKCVPCHGEGGRGDGQAGAALNPKPADLTQLEEDSDGRIFWRIAEGGTVEPFKTQGSLMPAWKTLLSQDEIWQVIAYLRTLK